MQSSQSSQQQTNNPIYPSICIPRVFKNIKREYIQKVFTSLHIGTIERIDLVNDKDKDKYNRAFIHLRWNQTENSLRARERILSGQDIKIIHSEPWFWKANMNRSSKI